MTRIQARLDWLATNVLPLLWHGRLSWLRIVLALVYGRRVYGFVRDWQTETPDHAYQGWMLNLVPQGIREFLLGHPQMVSIAVLVLIGLCVVGLATRPALVALALIGLFAFAIRTSGGVFNHSTSLATQVLVVLAFAPGTNTVSLDRFIRWWRAGRKDLWEYLATPYRQWGTKLILGLLAITYTTSALSKLWFGGFRWLDGETLGFYLRGLTSGSTVYHVGGGPPTWRDDFGLEMYTYGNYSYGKYGLDLLTGIVDWIAHSPAILMALSVATVALELSGFLLFVPKLRSFLLLAYIGMHSAIGLLMGLPFTEYRLICFFLIEWELLGAMLVRWLKVRQAAPPSSTDPDRSNEPVEPSTPGLPRG